MASIHKRGDGYLIQFYDKDGKRRGVSLGSKLLGKSPKKQAQNIAMHIEAMNVACSTGFPLERTTATWLSDQGEKLIAKFAKVGLIPPQSNETLGKFLDDYFKSRTDWATRTRRKHNTTKDYLEQFFTREKRLREITEADADNFHRHLAHTVQVKRKANDGTVTEGRMSDSTVWKHISNARVYFTAAIRHQLISDNPFTHVSVRKTSGQNYYFIKQDQATAVLEACPDDQWRLIFALARYGGLRIPSEIDRLEWSHVNWEKNKFLVHSPKTAHHTGQDKRFVPIFPELRPYLEKEFHKEDSEQMVITVARTASGELSGAYLRKRMLKIIERAGIVPWPKVFQNLRSTRQTELQERFPGHKVCKWLGNSEKVADKHYLQVTEDDFQLAAQPQEDEAEKVMLFLMRQLSEMGGNAESDAKVMLSKLSEMPGFSGHFPTLPTPQVAAEGLDTATLKRLIQMLYQLGKKK